MRGEPVYLDAAQQVRAFKALLAAAAEFEYRLLAVSVESWHAHVLVDHGYDAVAAVAGRLKTRMRQAVGCGRLWADGYDSRYCFDSESVAHRFDYINCHAGARALPAR